MGKGIHGGLTDSRVRGNGIHGGLMGGWEWGWVKWVSTDPLVLSSPIHWGMGHMIQGFVTGKFHRIQWWLKCQGGLLGTFYSGQRRPWGVCRTNL